MKKIKNSIITGFAFCVMFAMFQMTALAATGRIALTDISAKAGETIEVTVKASSADAKLSSATIVLEYDSDMLKFEDGDSATGGAGSITITGETSSTTESELAYVLTFKALESGDTSIKVSENQVVDTEGNKVDVSKVGSSSITIAEGTGEESSEETDADTATETGTAIDTESAVSANVGDAVLYVSSDYPEDQVPADFEPAEWEYQGQTIQGFKHKTGDLYMAYLVDGAQTFGYFYLYNPETDSFYEYIRIGGPGEKYIICGETSKSLELYGFKTYTATINDKTITGWQFGYDQDTIAAADFLVVWAMAEDGVSTWYVYDTLGLTYQRYFTQPNALIDSAAVEIPELSTTEQALKELQEKYNANMSSRLLIICILTVFAILCVFVSINLFLKTRNLEEELADYVLGDTENDYSGDTVNSALLSEIQNPDRSLKGKQEKKTKTAVGRSKETAVSEKIEALEETEVPEEMGSENRKLNNEGGMLQDSNEEEPLEVQETEAPEDFFNATKEENLEEDSEDRFEEARTENRKKNKQKKKRISVKEKQDEEYRNELLEQDDFLDTDGEDDFDFEYVDLDD